MKKAISDFFGAVLGIIVVLIVCCVVALTSGCATYGMDKPYYMHAPIDEVVHTLHLTPEEGASSSTCVVSSTV